MLELERTVKVSVKRKVEEPIASSSKNVDRPPIQQRLLAISGTNGNIHRMTIAGESRKERMNSTSQPSLSFRSLSSGYPPMILKKSENKSEILEKRAREMSFEILRKKGITIKIWFTLEWSSSC